MPHLLSGGGAKASQDLVCIDCGAHTGLITDLFLDLGAKVHSFEPNAYLYTILENKYKNNPNVILNKAALDDKNGKTTFMLYDPISQGNRLQDDYKQEWETMESEEVIVIDLVEYIFTKVLPNRIYLLKIDIEGAEFGILDKIISTRLYEKIDYIVCETHERYFSDGKIKMQNLYNKIKAENITNIFLDWV